MCATPKKLVSLLASTQIKQRRFGEMEKILSWEYESLNDMTKNFYVFFRINLHMMTYCAKSHNHEGKHTH